MCATLSTKSKCIKSQNHWAPLPASWLRGPPPNSNGTCHCNVASSPKSFIAMRASRSAYAVEVGTKSGQRPQMETQMQNILIRQKCSTTYSKHWKNDARHLRQMFEHDFTTHLFKDPPRPKRRPEVSVEGLPADSEKDMGPPCSSRCEWWSLDTTPAHFRKIMDMNDMNMTERLWNHWKHRANLLPTSHVSKCFKTQTRARDAFKNRRKGRQGRQVGLGKPLGISKNSHPDSNQTSNHPSNHPSKEFQRSIHSKIYGSRHVAG